jgi:hypothetical protein
MASGQLQALHARHNPRMTFERLAQDALPPRHTVVRAFAITNFTEHR